MASLLSNLFNNLSEGIHNVNTDTMIENVKIEELNIKIATLFMNVYSRKQSQALHKKCFPIRISSVNVTRSSRSHLTKIVVTKIINKSLIKS